MEFFNNHRKLFGTAFWFFLVLTLFVAVIPAIENQRINAPLPGAAPLSADAMEGKKIFISEGCVACHTQQVRNVDMDMVWGDRPGVAADYAGNTRMDVWRNTATLMGTERTGPDLTNVGLRQPGLMWNLVHLYQPRSVVPESVMPAYPWLFTTTMELDSGETEVPVPDEFRKGVNGFIIPTKKALQLAAYLQSLKQTPLPDGRPQPEFLYRKPKQPGIDQAAGKPDGESLYMANCQSCHQPNGEGLKGAFPSLKGSNIVTGTDIELFVTVIMKGYDAREEFAVMPAVGKNNNLTPDEITAIINHERSSWGNNAPAVSVDEVKKIMDFLDATAKN